MLAHALLRTQRRERAVVQLEELVGGDVSMVAPYHLQVEFSSTVRGLERRRLMSRDEADVTLQTFRSLPIEYRWDDAWVVRAIEIARAIGASRTYDSLYLACAEASGATLYTCDGSFVRAFAETPPNITLVD